VSRISVHHWRNQRLTALVLIPLTLWFVISMFIHMGDSRARIAAWLSRPVEGLLMAALVLCVLYHMVLGVRVVIEDYVADDDRRARAITAVNVAGFALAIVALAALAAIGFGR
jgi:succinate dehydrogenase / fumarate reductase, membrane anchor subunit